MASQTANAQLHAQRPPRYGLRARLIASHSIVIVVALTLLLLISTVYLRRYEVTVEKNRIEEFSKTLTLSINLLVRQGALDQITDRREAIDALATQEGIRLIVLSSTAEVRYDTDDSANLTGTTLDEFAEATARLIRASNDPATVDQRWLEPAPNSPFADQFVLLSSGGPVRQNLALLIVAPQRRYPLLAFYFPRVLVVAAISLAVASLVGSVLSVRLAAPINRLTVAADAMARGKLEQAVPGDGDDEIGRLVTSFNQMSRQIAAASLSQRELLANVAHELRTPLTSIQGYAQALRDDVIETESERQHALTIIGGEANRMATLIGQLLDLSRLESGQTKLSIGVVPVKQLVERVFERFQTSATDKGIHLESLSGPRLAIAGDEGRLIQLLSNLLDNAIRHTDQGGHIQVQAHLAPPPQGKASTHVRLIVSDTGEGIAPEHLSRIFERFNRGGDSDQEREGFGLGLAIVREIVGLHRGTIAVSSQVGVGTTWVIELPSAAPGDSYDSVPEADDR